MAILTETGHAAGFIVSEANGRRSRDNVTILAGSGSARALTAGMVLGKITASGKYVQFDDTAADGSEAAAGILITDATAPDGADVLGAALVRDAEVTLAELTWPGTADAGEQAAAVVQLGALGIIAR